MLVTLKQTPSLMKKIWTASLRMSNETNCTHNNENRPLFTKLILLHILKIYIL